jgi:predicted metal-dependent HD superfamily phosphohydrolase
MRHLAEAWLRTLGAAGADGDVAAVGADLLTRYAEPHRHYHDLIHLDEVLGRVDLIAGAEDDVAAVRIAAWFHDAVYRPGEEGNEERSAHLAETSLAVLRLPDRTVTEVARLVRLTAEHDAAPVDRNGAVLCDADLGVLAADPARYTSYAAGVRAEWAHVPDADFARGRAAVLRGLLSRATLFCTAPARAWEEPARRNIGAELARLGEPPD